MATQRTRCVFTTAITSVLLIALDVPVAAEFRANSHDKGSQRQAAVAFDGTGGFVVVWTHREENGAQPLQSVRGQRWTPGGRLRGGEFRVDLSPGDWGRQPAVAAAPDGRFVVVWEGGASNRPGRKGLWLSRFGEDGREVGGETRVNRRWLSADLDALPDSLQGGPQVAMLADGGCLVVWQDHGDGTCNRADVLARRFDPDGKPLGDEFVIHRQRTFAQVQPAIDSVPGGRFVVVWTDTRIAGSKDEITTIRGRILDRTGRPTGSEVVVAAGEPGDALRSPSVASLEGGGFVVAWLRASTSGWPQRRTNSVVFRVFEPNGSPRTDELQLAVDPAVDEALVRATPGGAFVVLRSVWDGTEGHGYVVRAMRYTGDGVGVDVPVSISPATAADRRLTDAAVTADGRLVAVWDSSSGDNVEGQRLDVSEQMYLSDVRSAGATVATRVEGNREELRTRHSSSDRVDAVRALGAMLQEAAAATPDLIQALGEDTDPAVRRAAALALAAVADRPREVAPFLVKALEDLEPSVRVAAAEALRRMGWPGGTPPVEAMVGDPSSEVRLVAVDAIAHAVSSETREQLADLMQSDRDPIVRAAAAIALGRGFGRDVEVQEDLVRALGRAEPIVRFGVVTGLSWNLEWSTHTQGVLESLARRETDQSTLLALLAAFRRSHSRIASDEVIALLGSDDPLVRDAALRTYSRRGKLWRKTSQERVVPMLRDSDSRVRSTALAAFQAVGIDVLQPISVEILAAAGDPDRDVRRKADIMVQWLVDRDCREDQLHQVSDQPR